MLCRCLVCGIGLGIRFLLHKTLSKKTDFQEAFQFTILRALGYLDIDDFFNSLFRMRILSMEVSAASNFWETVLILQKIRV